MDKLLPCPFCGGEAKICHVHIASGWHWEVICQECGCCTDGYGKDWRAIAAWNRRVQPDNAPLTLGELREMCRETVEVVGLPIGRDQVLGHQKDGYQYWEFGEAKRLDDYGITWLAYRRVPQETTP